MTKDWEDYNDADGTRPKSIKVALYKNSKKASEATLEAANNWTYTWTNLDMYENGKLISYEVKEPNVPSGYKLVGVTGDQTLGRRVINLLQPEARGRLNGLFVGLFFLGGAAGSAMAGVAWAWGGWPTVCVIGVVIAMAALLVDCLFRAS